MSAATEFDDFKKIAGSNYELGSDLHWEIGGKNSGWILTIPKGFRFDSSVPFFATWIVSRDHRAWLLAAAVHDYLLRYFDKAFAAGEWYRAARAKAKSDKKAWLVLPAYYGVIIWTVR